MSNRFKILKKIDYMVWLEGCPIKIVKTQILYDNISNNVGIQNKFQNISKGIIKGIFFDLECYDIDNNLIEKVKDCSYLSDKIEPREYFGGEKIIELTDSHTENAHIHFKKVIFSDGSVWNNENKNSPIKINAKEFKYTDGNYEIIKGLCTDNGIQPVYWPDENDIGWQCTCGQINSVEENRCCSCNVKKNILCICFSEEAIKNAKERKKQEQIAMGKKRKRIFMVLVLVLILFSGIKGYKYINYEKDLSLMLKNGKYGFVNAKGKFIIKPQFEFAREFNDKEIALVKKGNYEGLINKRGNYILEPEYDWIITFEELLRISLEGEQAKEKERDEALLEDGLGDYILLKKDGKYGITNEKGEIILALEYDMVSPFLNSSKSETGSDIFSIYKNEKVGLANEKGEIILKPEYDKITQYNSEVIEIQKKGMSGLVNVNGEIILEPEYDKIVLEPENDGFGEYDQVSQLFSHGLIEIQKNGKYGLVNTKGDMILTPEYDEIYQYYDGLIGVQKNSKYGLINTKGQFVLALEYNWLYQYYDDLIGIEKNGKYGLANAKGEIVVALEYDLIGQYGNGLIGIKKNGMSGLVNAKGEIILEPEYEEMTIYNNDLIEIQKNGRWGLVNAKGEIVLKPEYTYKELSNFIER